MYYLFFDKNLDGKGGNICWKLVACCKSCGLTETNLYIPLAMVQHETGPNSHQSCIRKGLSIIHHPGQLLFLSVLILIFSYPLPRILFVNRHPMTALSGVRPWSTCYSLKVGRWRPEALFFVHLDVAVGPRAMSRKSKKFCRPITAL